MTQPEEHRRPLDDESHVGPPDDAPPPPREARAGGQTRRASRIDYQITAPRRFSSPTVAFVQGRERVLGNRVWLHDEPCIAARQLVDQRGTLRARAWVRELMAELEAS